MQSQPSTVTNISKTELPEWVNQAAQQNYGKAEAIAGQPNNFYQGDRVANMQPTIDKLGGIWDKLSGPMSSQDAAAYMNPYIDNVENKALESLDRSRVMSLNGNSDAAVKANAFGGSRHGIVDAVTNSESARDAGNLSATLRSSAFDKASTDWFRNLTTSAEGITKTGLLDQANQQSQIDSDIKKFEEPRTREIDNLNLLLTSLGMSPYGQSSTQTQTAKGGSSGMDFGQLGLGLASMFFGLSDDDSKEDKQKVGETKDGLGIWAFRYKGDPKTYPKSIGLMASEIEKVRPDMVEKLDSGTRIVNYKGLEEAGLLAQVA